MTDASSYRDFPDFLSRHAVTKDAKGRATKESTHTRVPGLDHNGQKKYGGSYCIPSEELPVFYQLYCQHVLLKNHDEHLTERQLSEGGPILIDLDFRFPAGVQQRQYSQDHKDALLALYLEELSKMFDFDARPFPVFEMEKPNVNVLPDKTKDGIHIIIGIQSDPIVQTMLRDRVLTRISSVLEDLSLTNTYETVLDKGISEGTVNWQMYGSRKPGNEAYELVRYLTVSFGENGEWEAEEQDLSKFSFKRDLPLLSAQYNQHPKFPLLKEAQEEHDKRSKQGKGGAKKKRTLPANFEVVEGSDDEDNPIDEEDREIKAEEITNREILLRAEARMLRKFSSNTVEGLAVHQAHQYAQILPEKYYQPGSHDLNRRVAFALKNTHPSLWVSWIMLRSKAEDFDYADIPNRYQEWKTFHRPPRDGGLTCASIIFWAKLDAREEYLKLRESNIDHYITVSIDTDTDFDLAFVLYLMFKDKFVCSNLKNNTWYEFKSHRWHIDTGESLRLAISRDMYFLYQQKQGQYFEHLQTLSANNNANNDNTEAIVKLQARIKKIVTVSMKLKNTSNKNHIMTEAKALFYDRNFIRNMDANPYLLCCTNGVVDFQNNEFRPGHPLDYITKCTGVPFIPMQRLLTNNNSNNNNSNSSNNNNSVTVDASYNDVYDDDPRIMKTEIELFMKQLFPRADTDRYMWDHLASVLIGVKKEQVFNIYRGSGSNGKSILTDLMSKVLGDYKGTVPITLVTDKRVSLGGTSSEVIQLKGIRYAVMQEPSKDASINEGVMKEMTGGDPIQARALYCESEIFIPQFSLVVCTNNLFEIKSNDDGTWRRMKVVDFVSKFYDENDAIEDTSPYRYPKDKSLKEKLGKWAPVFLSMLVERAFATHGEVKDCFQVTEASRKYREGQDVLASFMHDRMETKAGGCIGKRELMNEFKQWTVETGNHGRKIKMGELTEYMNLRYPFDGRNNKWKGVCLVDPNRDMEGGGEGAEEETD